MAYLSPTEYVAYGLTAETTDDLVEMASVLIDAHCRRPSLLVTQYVERMRITAGSQAVRLSYLPLSPLNGASSRSNTPCQNVSLGEAPFTTAITFVSGNTFRIVSMAAGKL